MLQDVVVGNGEMVEKDKWTGSHPQQLKIFRWEDGVSAEAAKLVGNPHGCKNDCWIL